MDKRLPRILIYDTPNMNIGATRIFAHGLYQDLAQLELDVHYGIKDNISDFDIVVYGKNQRQALYKDNTSKIKGLIQPSDFSNQLLNESLLADFWIVGSYEEMDYYLQYKSNIAVYPLIERYKTEKKTHKEKKHIIIGYHGNKKHLEELSPDLCAALEEVSRKHDIRLRAVYDIATLGMWQKNRPHIAIEDVQWSLETLPSQILSMDIGIVPLLTHMHRPFSILIRKFMRLIRPEMDASTQDYLLQFKNNTNPGRCFVFQQFGIPVVAELSPSASAAIPNEQYGYTAYSQAGWFRALDHLCSSAALRNTISDNAHAFFSSTWNTDAHIPKIVSMIEMLWKRRNTAIGMKSKP